MCHGFVMENMTYLIIIFYVTWSLGLDTFCKSGNYFLFIEQLEEKPLPKNIYNFGSRIM